MLRLKDDYDGAEPSGNSVMALLLLRLARMTDRADFRAAAERTLRAFASRMEESGTGCRRCWWRRCSPWAARMEIVLAGPRDDPAMLEMLASIRRRFLPERRGDAGDRAPQPMPALEGAATAYVCENFACKLPVTNAAALDELLQ